MNSKYYEVWAKYYISPDTCFMYSALKKHDENDAVVFLELAVRNNKYFRHNNVEEIVNNIKSLLE